ncbi:MAG: hypothetical protein R3C60_10175 [Parvularculaceae bacterium]
MKRMCWISDGGIARGRMYRWSKQVAGGYSTADGMRFGALVFETPRGAIQLVAGGYRHVNGGVEVTKGTGIIYPAKCKGA